METENESGEQERRHSEAPAEGNGDQEPGNSRSHPQSPAEGEDDDGTETADEGPSVSGPEPSGGS
ncbi:hypothetical protein IV498_11480 [Paenarthrobacter sp. Z7-10]|uniref:hypothetical protein n=1 Tax=Paenarthrobacter sp. Z7-10 TaxID=2787635 RepID=UPI0022A91A26|nr:hypothetical protein [Paenarthrobacter sp. Z7-10]MCZ2403790.1 hypothetical protein [Paenarthrobacter sp. Z7-10]